MILSLVAPETLCRRLFKLFLWHPLHQTGSQQALYSCLHPSDGNASMMYIRVTYVVWISALDTKKI